MADAMREALEKIAAFDCDSWMIGVKCSGCRTCIAAEALAQHPAMSAADEAEQFIQDAIDRAPEPLRRLGEYLTQILDEDEWRTAERMLIGAAEQPAQHAVVPTAHGEAVGHLYRLIVEGQVVGARYMDGPKLFGVFGKPGRDHGGKETATAIYTAPPAPSVSVPDALRVDSWSHQRDKDRADGWNACRAAMLASGGKASVPYDVARKVAIAEWIAQNSWWTYSAASEAVAMAERLAAPEPQR